MVDQIHERPEGTAGAAFRRNRERFVEGEDFTSIDQPDVIRRLGFSRPQGGTPASVILLSRRGYLKLVKPMDDDCAWAVQGEMVDRYFMVEQIAEAINDDDLRIEVSGELCHFFCGLDTSDLSPGQTSF